MKSFLYFSAFTILVLTTACSSSGGTLESQNEPYTPSSGAEESAGETTGREAPLWYKPGTDSVADSSAFYGFSLAAGTDSARTADRSFEMADRNLRFEIDRFAEEVRRMAVEDGSGQSAGSEFIMNLRKSVQTLRLEQAEVVTEGRETGEGVYEIYTRIRFGREQAARQLAQKTGDSAFSEALESGTRE